MYSMYIIIKFKRGRGKYGEDEKRPDARFFALSASEGMHGARIDA